MWNLRPSTSGKPKLAMPELATGAGGPWRYWPHLFLGVFFIGVTTQMICNAIPSMRVDGDFDIHREFGRRFLAGEDLYLAHPGEVVGFCFNYMPISAMYYAPLALLSPNVGPLARYAVALVCLALTFSMLAAMVRPQCDPRRWDHAAVIALTALLGLHYLLRDLTDGGPHCILLAMLVGGIYCAWRGREKLSALWFGLAIAVKMSPGLFLPFLVWKRKWRLAAYTTIATALWIALPAVVMGPANWWKYQQCWNRVALNVAGDKMDSNRQNNELRIQNQALKPALLRYLVKYPPGHPLKVDHPADVAVLSLPSAVANRVANLSLLAVLGGFAWWSRRRYRGADDPAWLLESSAVLILVLLLSPLTWLQHMPLLIPAIYLLVAQNRAVEKLPRWATVALWAYVVFSLLLNRGTLGARNYFLLLSFHTHTLCMLILMGLVMVLRPMGARAQAAGKEDALRAAA